MLIMKELLELLVKRGGSDLHIAAGSPPKVRLHGRLVDTEYEPLSAEDTKSIIYGVLSSEQIARFERDIELDLSFGMPGLGRFRTNLFVQRGAVGAVLRVVPEKLRGFEDLGLPVEICEDLCRLPKGLILVTGATRGLGFMLVEGREFVRIDIIVGGIILFSLVGKLVDQFVRLLESRFLRWRDTFAGG